MRINKLLIILILSMILISGCIQKEKYIEETKPVERTGPLKCGYCQYPIDEYTCGNYVCCKDSECDDDNSKTVDTCINPQTRSARCSNVDTRSVMDKLRDQEEKEEQDEEPEILGVESCGSIQQGECSGLKVCDDGVFKESVLNCGCSKDKVIINGKCEDQSYTRTVKVAIIEVISQDAEVPITTYYCDTETCKANSAFCNPNEKDCVKFDVDFLEAINNDKKVMSIHFADDLFSQAGFRFGSEIVPLGPWYSFYYINDWYAQQAKDITGSRKEKIDISILGPYKVSTPPPARGRTDPCVEILNPYFENIANQYNINLEEYDVISYVYFDDLSYGTARFLSCATHGQGLAFNNILMSIDNINSELKTVAHEVAHTLGALDRYGGFLCQVPEGIPEPNKLPLYPQTKACLMCGNIMLSESRSGTSVPITDQVICEKTAEEIGWS